MNDNLIGFEGSSNFRKKEEVLMINISDSHLDLFAVAGADGEAYPTLLEASSICSSRGDCMGINVKVSNPPLSKSTPIPTHIHIYIHTRISDISDIRTMEPSSTFQWVANFNRQALEWHWSSMQGWPKQPMECVKRIKIIKTMSTHPCHRFVLLGCDWVEWLPALFFSKEFQKNKLVGAWLRR